jgi:hypothetical protein
LERALERVKALPEDQQDAIASQIFDSLSDDALWAEQFSNKEKLERLASEALSEHRRGDTRSLDDLL